LLRHIAIRIYDKFLNSKIIRNHVKQKPREELHNFWRNPRTGNLPEEYVFGEERSVFLVNLIKKYESNKSAKFLDIGCNVGRNLHYVQKEGYHNLSGIEISTNAVQLMKKEFPKLASDANIYNEPVEERIKLFTEKEFDVIYTMAVLEHIHVDSNFVFEEIARITKKTLITIEDEKSVSSRHFPRNYKTIFEKFGLKQIEEIHCASVGMNNKNVYARVFTKL